MSLIKNEDFISSIADAFQFISYFHSIDFIESLTTAYENEASPAAKDAIGQILVNSRMCAEGQRPLCQDTGIAVVFLDIGMSVRWESNADIEKLVNDGVARAYNAPHNPLRASIVNDPAGKRQNTKDNTPAVIHMRLVPGDKVSVAVAAKGGGSENKSKLVMLNPSDDIAQWVEKTIPTMGAGWCPPGILGIGIGGTAEKAMLLAKQSLMAPIDMHKLLLRGPKSTIDELRIDIYQRVNALGVGAQGLGGLTTVLDVKILDYPTHAASKPVAMIPNCAATRHLHFTLDGSGPAKFTPPALKHWPDISLQTGKDVRRVNLDNITPAEIKTWKPGNTLLISGKILTGRDAAHKKLVELINRGEAFPNGLDFHNRFIYYVGPVDAVNDEVIGPAGPTTSTRMDKFTETMLAKTGLLGMIGKAERGALAIESIKKHQAIYLIATGGAAYLVSKSIREARIIAFPELGMEAIQEFVIEDMPVTVAVDTLGNSIHTSGPAEWKIKIQDIKKYK